MFKQDELARLIDLQDRSYRLFLWLNQSLRVGLRSYDSVSKAVSFAEASAAWIRKYAGEFPDDLRPAPEELDDFASLFVSYLSTSFEVVDGRSVPSCRYCFCCGYLELPRHLGELSRHLTRGRHLDPSPARGTGGMRRSWLRGGAEVSSKCVIIIPSSQPAGRGAVARPSLLGPRLGFAGESARNVRLVRTPRLVRRPPTDAPS